MKKTLSILFIFVLVACIGVNMAFAAEPVIISNSGNTTVYSGSSSTASDYSYSSGGIVIIDPNTGKPASTPAPVITQYVIDTVPTITKNPTAETSEYGGEIVFVARADYATSIEWFLTDGTTYIVASEVGNNFPGVTATGTNSERLVLSNVTDKLTGWSAMARFTNDIGTVWSAEAAITVEADPTATPAPTATPLPAATVAPTPTPVPANTTTTTNTTTGTATQHGTGDSSVTTVNNGSTVGNSNTTTIGNTSDGTDIATATGITTTGTAGTGSAGTGRSTHVGAYILAALAGIVIIGSIIIMALYMKGKISLGKFEKFLGSFGNENDAEMFDANSEFYNPDDFKDEKNKK